MRKLPEDPVIDEVREVRHRISERLGHDPKRIVQHYIELQREHSGPVVEAPERPEVLTES
jgi:hypothetical protein